MKYKINLFPQKEQNIVDAVIYFSFHYLRYILVITQLVVIFVFFYRFKVDQEIIDLKDSLDQKQEIVQVSQPLLKEVESVSNKTNIINDIVDSQDIFLGIHDYIITRFPASSTLSRLDISEGNAEFEGTTQDIVGLRSFYYRLQKEAKFTKIELTNLRKTEFGYAFLFSLTHYIEDKKT